MDFNSLNISFDNQTFKYDGQEKSILINGDLPTDISVSYSGNNKSDIGEQEVIATFKDEQSHYENVHDLKAKMTIVKGDYDMSNIVFSDCYFDYDELSHSKEISFSNGYVLPVFEMNELKEAIVRIQEGKDNLKKWENKDPMAIIKMIDKFIEDNWK